MPAWRYAIHDLITDTHITDLPLKNVSFDRRLCQPGAFSATLPITNARVAAAAREVLPMDPGDLSRGPGRMVVHVWRNDRDLGQFIIWSATINNSSGRTTVQLSGASLESWLHHRIIRHDLTYVGWDQVDLARDLVYQAQHPPGGGTGYDIGLTYGGNQASSRTRDRTYLASETASYGQRLEELSQVDHGIEWLIVGREFQALTRATGSFGSYYEATYPGTITDWSYLMDAAETGTSWQTRGARDDTTDEAFLSAVTTSTDHTSAGWPVLDQSIDYQGVVLTSTLDAYATWWRTHRSGISRILQVTVASTDDNLGVPPERLGSDVMLSITDLMWPPGADGRPTLLGSRRVVGVELSPHDRGGPDRLRYIFEEPADNPREGIPQFPPDWGRHMSGVSARIHDAYTAATNR
ncbi:hypothetical protein [Nocardiopsis synnemataformans]|uniref:hypothetical protein n=1 Tax=Nocardiopsis synnemataformans TaxID=61305 RepID=UPI003EBD294E